MAYGGALTRARHMLETQGRFPGGAVPPDIADSWLRSLDYDLDPLAKPRRLVLGDVETRRARERHEDLLRFARPEIELLFDQIAGSNFMIALGSPDGVVLDTLKDASVANTKMGQAIIEGSVWTEALRGTNALGLCVSTQRVAQVYGGEHFMRDHADVACISAPIFDGRGALAGVLDASAISSARQQHTAALVSMAAGNIENCLIRSLHEDRIVLMFHPRPEYLATLSVGILVLDGELVHAANRKGELFLHGLGEPVGQRFDELFEWPFDRIAERLARGETLRVRDRLGSAVSVRCVANRASFRLAARRSPYPSFRAAEPCAHGDLDELCAARSADIVLDDPRLRKRLRSLPDRARNGDPIAIVGEPGTGRSTVARLAHMASGREDPLVAVDARALGDSDGSAWFGDDGSSGILAEANCGTLVIDEPGELPACVLAALNAILDAGEFRHPRSGERVPCAPLIVCTLSDRDFAYTRTDEGGDELSWRRLRERVATVPLVLPPVRERTDLWGLARAFLYGCRRDLELGQVGSVLADHPWNGNLHELKSVVREAARMATGTLESHDLEACLPASTDAAPTACRDCFGTPWKEQRCETIRRTVEASNGVAQAARALGMSRTTIYKHLSD